MSIRPFATLASAVHCLILEGRAAFDEQYLVSDGPVNARTNEPFGKSTKAYAKWLAGQDSEVVSARVKVQSAVVK